MSRIRAMSFVARFAIASAVLLLVAGGVLAHLLTGIIEERGRNQAEQTGVVAVRLGIAPLLDVDDFERVVGAETRTMLDRALVDAKREDTGAREHGHHALRIKIFNANGMVIYSDLDEIVGKTFGSADLRRALRGEVISKMTDLEDPDELADKRFQRALEVYVPLSYGADRPVGVAEIYLPYEPVAEAITQDTRVVYGALGATLVTFYLVMYRMVSRTSRRLRDSSARNDYLAHHDTLTGLPNRALLSERLERVIVHARRHGTGVGVLLIDLDRFKEINDTLGHETGDLLLQQVGDRIAGELREIDTVARLGGDEFVVLLPEVSGVEAAVTAAQRVLRALHQPFAVRGVDLAVEASVGVACYPEHGEDPGTLLQHADVAMYVAKQARGTYAVYDAHSDVSSLSRITLLTELRRALEEQQMVLHYQPKEELADGTVRGVEALVRWKHPTRGLVPPDEFIPVAEQTGLISALTAYVVSNALVQVRAWQDEGRDVSVAVNLSARNLMDPQFPDVVASLLEQTGVDAGRLEVEITETSAMADPARATEVLDALSRLGVSVTVDDYGTGFSSLSYLRRLPIGTLKIDRSFVTDMLRDEGDAAIVKSTIEMARNLGLRVVAEGVEDNETHDALIALGCHVAQGYYLSRPLPPQSLAALLDERNRSLAEVAGAGRPPRPEAHD